MDKMDKNGMDFKEINIERMKALFPECVTDGKIDFDKLKVLLGEEVDSSNEKYSFNWIGKNASIKNAITPSAATLIPCKEKSKNWDTTENLYIEGDNLEVLKTLSKTYHGQIKMIYIDPPYNTGKDFVYHDNFHDSTKDYIENTQQSYRVNPETSGKYHTNWLNMMYPRLKVAKDLLKDDGVIFISIDDNEQDNLKKIAGEIFGENNFIGQLVLKTATDNNPSQINTEHEYMLCFAKNRFEQTNWVRKSEAANKIIQQYKQFKKDGLSCSEIQLKLRGWIKAHKDELPQVAHYNNVDEKGVYSNSSNSSNPHPGGYMFDIIHPITGIACPKPQNGWRWPEKTFLQYDAQGDIEWGKDHTTQPHVKKRIETSVEYLRSLIYEDNRATTKLLADMFDGNKVFDNPKPINVISRIIDFVTEKDSIILDCFSGSATTAHAVMDLNFEDGGNRKFILVQLPEKCDSKSDAFKFGFNNICDIGEERIRRAGDEILELNKASETTYQVSLFEETKVVDRSLKNLDVGFKVFKLDSTCIKPWDPTVKYDESNLFELMDVIKEGRSNLDVAYEIMLKYGVFNMPLEEKVVNGKTIYSVGGGYMIISLNDEITSDDVKAIAELKPKAVVFKESGFKDDSAKMNADYTFKRLGIDNVKCI